MLLLFDIDATLLKTSGVGILAMVDAGRELFGPTFTSEGVETAGRLDPLIIVDMLRVSGLTATPDAVAAVREGYRRHLIGRLATPGAAYALPGVHDLLDALAQHAGRATIGLLTGNYSETGKLKLAACGIDESRFPIQVWGDDSPHDPPARDHLPPVGLRRYREHFARTLHPAQATIIGDTPHDVRCAKAHGLRSLAVATGPYSPDELAAAGADRVVESLRDADDLVRWLVK
jgi:phosphoglycolate phosphatase